jgi:4-amino-4-deoxy-L-arabinose transferase-like glycosyltransferase
VWVAVSDVDTVLSRWGKQNTDAIEYHQLAQNILDGKGYSLEGRPTSYRPPLYPAFLTGIYSLAGGTGFSAVKYTQAAFGALCVLFIFLITRLLFRRRSAEIIAGIIAAFYILHIYWTSEIYTETLFMLLMATSLFLLLKFAQTEKNLFLLGGGVALGLAALCRSTALIFAPFVILWLGIFFRKNLRALFGRVFMFLAVLILVIFPWALRNYRVHNAFVLISTNGGRTFSAGVANDYLASLGLKGLIPKTRFHSGTEVERDKSYYGVAWRAIGENKLAFAGLTLRKFLHFWSPWVTGQRRLFIILGAASYIPILVLGTLGIIFSLVKKEAPAKMVLLILFLFLSLSLLHAIYIPNIRFRLPVVDPYLMVFTGYFFSYVLERR